MSPGALTTTHFEVALPEDEQLARRLGVSLEAVQLTRKSDVIDLHVDTFIPPRLWGYDLLERHERGPLAGRFFGHLDFHRILEGGMTGAMWSITTNPFRTAGSRWQQFQKNLTRFQGLIERTRGRYRFARTRAEYDAARQAGAHAVMLAIQGGNALEAAPEGVASLPDQLVTRVTLVHLTNSVYGVTSSPLAGMKRGRGLTGQGRDFVRQLDAHRIFVDLAHINPEGFWEAVEAHDRSLPLIATHTGVSGVKPHWRNLDDRQVKAIADSGGVVGVIFAAQFLRVRGGPRDSDMVLDHLAHTLKVGGEDAVALGSDYDGAITPPPDLRDGLAWPRLVQRMLDRGWKTERIQKILGKNFLASFARLRP